MTRYQINIHGHLDHRWETAFNAFSILHQYDSRNQPISVISGEVIDQAALYGIIDRLCDLGAELISINPDLEK